MVGLIGLFLHLGSTVPVVTAKEACSSLSAEIGKQVSVSRDLAGRFVNIQRHGKSAQIALSALADCLHATVVDDGDGITIERTKANIKETKNHIVAERIKWIEGAINRKAQQRKRVLGLGQGGNPADIVASEFLRQQRLITDSAVNKRPLPDLSPLRDLLPSEGLLIDIVRRVTPKKIAEASLQENTVFEDQPVLSNESLPPHSDLDARYEGAMEAFAAKNPPVQATNGEMLWKQQVAPYALGWGSRTKGIDRLRLAEVCLGNEIDLQLGGYDSDGNLVAYSDFIAGPTEASKTPAELYRSGIQNGEQPEWYPLTPQGATAVSFASQYLPKSFPDWFLHPDKIEPLNLIVPTALDALASEEPDRCVAFEVTDSFWALVIQSSKEGRLSLTTLKQAMQRWTPFEKQSSTEFVAWRPVDPFSVEARQSDRHELAHFAKDSWSQKNVGLRSVGRLYRYGSPQPGLLTNVWEYDARVALAQWETPGKNLTARMYRLVGAISDDDWKQLIGGSAMSAGKPNVVDELKEALCQEFGTVPEGKSMFPALYQHPAELYQQDQLSKTLISAQSLNTPLIQDWPQASELYTMWAPVVSQDGTPVIFKHLRLELKNGHAEPASNRDQFEASFSPRKFRTGHADDSRLTISLPRNLWIEMLSRGYGIDDTDAVAFTDLPKDLRDILWEAVSQEAAARIKGLSNPTPPIADAAAHAVPPL